MLLELAAPRRKSFRPGLRCRYGRRLVCVPLAHGALLQKVAGNPKGPLEKCSPETFFNSPPKMRLSGWGIPLSAESGQGLRAPGPAPEGLSPSGLHIFAGKPVQASHFLHAYGFGYCALLYWAAASTNRCPHWGFPQKYKWGNAAYRFFSPKPHGQLLPETGFWAVKLSPFSVESQ